MFAPRHDWDECAHRFRQEGRLRLEHALSDQIAEDIHQRISSASFAMMLARQGQGVVMTPSDLQQLSGPARNALQQEIHGAASRGEGFVYEGHQLAKSENAQMQAILSMINSADTLDRIRQLTGMSDITHADGQATRYRTGHFLTRHRDDPDGQQRRLAYVLSLTRHWHPDWGGLLQFFEDDGTPRDAWSPGWNILSIFDVRHVHSVTYVTPFAAAPRLSVTGWFRAGVKA